MSDGNVSTMKFVPLELAFARTIHKFQGQECGPNKKIRCIVGDPGKKSFEILNPGTFYTLLSRASTLGGKDGKGSAIYFCGENISNERLMNIGKRTQSKNNDGDFYVKVAMRNKWIEHLNENIHNLSSFTDRKISKFMRWYQNTSVNRDKFDYILQYHIENR